MSTKIDNHFHCLSNIIFLPDQFLVYGKKASLLRFSPSFTPSFCTRGKNQLRPVWLFCLQLISVKMIKNKHTLNWIEGFFTCILYSFPLKEYAWLLKIVHVDFQLIVIDNLIFPCKFPVSSYLRSSAVHFVFN